jgi:hypothetical protein
MSDDDAQNLLCVGVSGVLALSVESVSTGRTLWPAVPHTAASLLGIGILALISTAAAMVALTWAQSRLSGSRTAVVLALEPAAAGVTAVALGADLTLRTAVGAAMLIAAMLVVESGGRHRKTVGHLELISGMVSYFSVAVRGLGRRPTGSPEYEVARLPEARPERSRQCRSI